MWPPSPFVRVVVYVHMKPSPGKSKKKKNAHAAILWVTSQSFNMTHFAGSREWVASCSSCSSYPDVSTTNRPRTSPPERGFLTVIDHRGTVHHHDSCRCTVLAGDGDIEDHLDAVWVRGVIFPCRRHANRNERRCSIVVYQIVRVN